MKKLTFLLLLAAYVALHLYHLSYFALGHDEVFSVLAAESSWSEMMRTVIADVVHPPLFYILIKLWIAVGGHAQGWIQGLPFAISLLLPIPLWLICNEFKFSENQTLAALALIAFNPVLILYSQVVRTYSLLAVLSLFSLWLFVRALQGRVNWVALFVVNLLLAYTHYFGGLFVATELLAGLIWAFTAKDNWRTWLPDFVWASAFDLALFVPWLWLVFRAAVAKHGLHENLKYNSLPTPRDVTWFYAQLSGTLPLRHSVAVGMLLFTVAMVAAFRRPLQERARMLSLAAFVVVLTALAVLVSTAAKMSIFEPRYLITVAVPLLLMAVVGLPQLPRSAAGSLAAWCIVCGIYYVHQQDRVQWNQLAARIGSEPVPVYTLEPHEQLPLEFYGARNTMLEGPQDVLRLNSNDFYVVYRDSTWPGAPKQILAAHGYAPVESLEFAGAHETIRALRVRRETHPGT